MKFGAHIRTGPGLATVIDRAEAMGAEAVQVFPQNSRAWKSRRLDPVLFAEYRAKQVASATVRETYVHAIYLINLASPDADVRARSRECLLGNMRVAEGKVPFGAGSDRHENLGEGHIGEDRLAVFLGHPALQDLPAILEISGIEGHGPGPADLEVARRIHAEGLALYR